MTKKKKLTYVGEYSSIFGQPKHLEVITLTGFSQRKAKENVKFLRRLNILLDKYNDID